MRAAVNRVTPEVDLSQPLEESGPQLVRRSDIAGSTMNLTVWSRFLITDEEGTRRLVEEIPENVKLMRRLGGPAASPGADRTELVALAQTLKDQVIRLAGLAPNLHTYADKVILDLNHLLTAAALSDVDYSSAIAAAEAAIPERLPGSLKQWTVELLTDYLLTMAKCFGDPTHGGMQEREQLCDAVKRFAREATATLLSDPHNTAGLLARLAEIRAACIQNANLPSIVTDERGWNGRPLEAILNQIEKIKRELERIGPAVVQRVEPAQPKKRKFSRGFNFDDN